MENSTTEQNNTFNRIYEVVRQIPYGQVATYGQIAELAGNKRWARVVGYALHSNPDPDSIPCYRVVNREGRVSSAFAFGGGNAQMELLCAEGIVFEDIVGNQVKSAHELKMYFDSYLSVRNRFVIDIINGKLEDVEFRRFITTEIKNNYKNNENNLRKSGNTTHLEQIINSSDISSDEISQLLFVNLKEYQWESFNL